MILEQNLKGTPTAKKTQTGDLYWSHNQKGRFRTRSLSLWENWKEKEAEGDRTKLMIDMSVAWTNIEKKRNVISETKDLGISPTP